MVSCNLLHATENSCFPHFLQMKGACPSLLARMGWGLQLISVHLQNSWMNSSPVSCPMERLPWSNNFGNCGVLSCQRFRVCIKKLRTPKVKVLVLSQVRLFATPRTVTHQAPLSMGFSRQEYWSRLPFPSLGDLPDLGIEAVM